MPEVTRRRSGELVRGVFTILMDHPEGLAAQEVFQLLERLVPPTQFEHTTYPNRPNDRRYEKIVRFRSIAQVKAGWLVKDKGRWWLTDEGRAAYKRLKDPEAFMREADRLYREWASERSEPESEEPKPDEIQADAAAALEEAQEVAWIVVQRRLAGMGPYDFQDLVAGLLTAMGYHVAWVSRGGPDKGLDVIAYTDPLGIRGPRIKVQVKRRDEAIDVDGLRAFMALLSEDDVGIFVSMGGFTKPADNEARSQEKRRVILLDARRLFDLWVEHYGKVPEEARRLLPLRPVHYLDLES